MPKTETQEQPTAARPPRPAPRGKSEARAPGSSGEAVPGAYSAFRLAPNTTGEGAGADVGWAAPTITALEDAPAVPDRVESFEQASANGESFGRPRANVLGGLPLASLEGPSMASLDLTPSPVPRVSLVHANGAVDVSLVPGPHVIGSRNLPTVAARHVLGPARARPAAPAMTLPPQTVVPLRAESLGQSRLAQKVKTGMRSSKREIVLGLSIGVGLSVVLAGLGQSYVDSERTWQAQGVIETAKLSALPQPAAAALPMATLGELNVAAEGDVLTSSASIPDEPVLAAKPAAPTPKLRRSSNKARQVSKRAAAPPVEAPAFEGAPPREPKSLSPSESAGLGLDLPL